MTGYHTSVINVYLLSNGPLMFDYRRALNDPSTAYPSIGRVLSLSVQLVPIFHASHTMKPCNSSSFSSSLSAMNHWFEGLSPLGLPNHEECNLHLFTKQIRFSHGINVTAKLKRPLSTQELLYAPFPASHNFRRTRAWIP